MVNSGAIATTSLVPGDDVGARWELVHETLSRFAGRTLVPDEEVYASATATNWRNRGIARLLQGYDLLGCDPEEAVDLYTRQCSLAVTAHDLAAMGATLADGGVNPLTGERVVGAETARYTLAVMTTAGPLRDLGRLALRRRPAREERHRRRDRHGRSRARAGSARSPRCSTTPGNSVKGQLVARFLSRRLGLDLLGSEPER